MRLFKKKSGYRKHSTTNWYDVALFTAFLLIAVFAFAWTMDVPLAHEIAAWDLWQIGDG